MTASPQRTQCSATTKKGNRCKLYALPGGKRCHIHVKRNEKQAEKEVQAQKNNAVRVSGVLATKVEAKIKLDVQNSKTATRTKNDTLGNIYVFTYAHMMHSKPTTMPYLHLAEPTPNNWINYSKTSPFDPCDQILIKVGFTRKKPEVRIKEWREQCGHSEFILLYPGCLAPMYRSEPEKKSMKKLEKLFQSLKIGKSSKGGILTPLSNRTHQNYSNLNAERTCFVSPTAYQSEQRIHKILRERYGSGKLFCEGCAKHKVLASNQLARTIGVHTEWFLVPRCEMKNVWLIIEGQCKV